MFGQSEFFPPFIILTADTMSPSIVGVVCITDWLQVQIKNIPFIKWDCSLHCCDLDVLEDLYSNTPLP
jgi:hypothetical protein